MEHKFKPNADSMNALFNALGALVFATVRQLPPEQQKAFQQDLMALALGKNRVGDTTSGTAILDLALAAEVASKTTQPQTENRHEDS